MGHRANLVLVEQDTAKIYRSHWDGHKVLNILTQGLDFCEKHFRKFPEVDWLYDNAWAEGGLLVDKDKKQILFFNLELLDTVGHQNAFIDYLKVELWKGWDIFWAFRGNVDIAEYINIMEDSILAEGCLPEYEKIDNWKDLLSEIGREGTNKTLVTIVCDKVITDYVLEGHWDEINFCIAEGEELKEVLPDAFKLFNTETLDEGEINDVLLVNYDRKEIYACWNYDTDDRHVEAIPSLWPGWKATRQTQGVSFNFDETNRKRNYRKMSQEKFIDYLRQWGLLEYRE